MQNDIKEFLGKTLSRVVVNRTKDTILFTFDNGESFKMFHSQNCCEKVHLEDVAGDWDELLGSPLLIAECVSNEGSVDTGVALWTFYKLATINGYVTLRWYGTSNGYYSTSVSIVSSDDEDYYDD